MGFVSTLIINNDQIESLKNDPEAGKKIFDAVMTFSNRLGAVDAGNGATVVACHHASIGVPVLVGGGMFYTRISNVLVGEHEPNKELALLKALADKHGMCIRKKSTTRKARRRSAPAT